ncbi:Protein transport protein Sec31A [Hordeum vulgare]|nr:Protein transport protein Sec31A [Hordeum vulgare]
MMQWGRIRGGSPIVADTEAVVDFIPTNRSLKVVNLPGRVSFMRQRRARRRAPQTSHEEGIRDPFHFYVQICDGEDLAMLIIPPKFVEVMKGLADGKALARGEALGQQVVRVLGSSPELRMPYGPW